MISGISIILWIAGNPDANPIGLDMVATPTSGSTF